MINFSAPLSALDANSVGMNASAHNVANVNTNDYSALSTQFQTNSGNNGVSPFVTQDRVSFSAQAQELAGNFENVNHTLTLNNNVDYARETASSITYQRAFEANTASIRTADDMLGTVLDLIA